MEKILIATRNKDKFEVVTKILNKIFDKEYEYYSLYDIDNVTKDDKEEGTIEQRAYKKAMQIYTSIEENEFKYIVGIDDGIKMKGILRENVKEYMRDIINGKYLIEGEQVQIVRAYCFIDQEGGHTTIITQIPFKYKKFNGKLEIKENSYPLSNVLTPMDNDRPVSQIEQGERNEYYVKYSEEQFKDLLENSYSTI